MVRFVVTGCILILMMGCGYNASYVQNIEINCYGTNEKNVQLVKDLMYFNTGYLQSKVPGFDKSTASGIQLGYFIRARDGQAIYRIKYDLKNASVAVKFKELQKGFADFIPKLAASQVAKGPLFQELEPSGVMWVKSIFSKPVAELFNESSPLLKKLTTIDQFSKVCIQLRKEYGKPTVIKFVRAQYYERTKSMPESISLYYLTSFASYKKLLIRVSMYEQKGKWLVLGFGGTSSKE